MQDPNDKLLGFTMYPLLNWLTMLHESKFMYTSITLICWIQMYLLMTCYCYTLFLWLICIWLRLVYIWLAIRAFVWHISIVHSQHVLYNFLKWDQCDSIMLLDFGKLGETSLKLTRLLGNQAHTEEDLQSFHHNRTAKYSSQDYTKNTFFDLLWGYTSKLHRWVFRVP